MYKVGDIAKWRTPLEAMYSYGTVLEIQRKAVILREIGYYQGCIVKVPKQFVQKFKPAEGGSRFGSSNKKYSK